MVARLPQLGRKGLDTERCIAPVQPIMIAQYRRWYIINVI
jgi:hypothetical protein